MTRFERACPFCGKNHPKDMADLRFGDFDQSGLNRRVILLCCQDCGQVYNEIKGGPAVLDRFYRDQALYFAEMGVGSGGLGPLDLERYGLTLEKLAPFLTGTSTRIADVGCAKGGFLTFLKDRGYRQLMGVDVNRACVDHVQETLGIPARQGSVYRLPFQDGELDVLVLSHVLEHLYDVHGAIREMKRVLGKSGILFIEQPDADRYAEFPVAGYYWLAQREHINHFDSSHLARILLHNGLSVIQAGQMEMGMAPGVKNPTIYAVAAPGRPNVSVAPKVRQDCLAHSLSAYLDAQEKEMDVFRRLVKELAQSGRPVFPWGIGLEFFTLYEIAGLNSCNLGWLVDRNPAKLQRTVAGLPIRHPDSLADLGSEAMVAITSVLHKAAMMEHLTRSGFQGQWVSLV